MAIPRESLRTEASCDEGLVLREARRGGTNGLVESDSPAARDRRVERDGDYDRSHGDAEEVDVELGGTNLVPLFVETQSSGHVRRLCEASVRARL